MFPEINYKKLIKFELKEIFPNKWTVIIFLGYIICFVIHGMLVTSEQKVDNSYHFHTGSVIFITQLIELLVSIFFYAIKYPLCSLFDPIEENIVLYGLYIIPAILYCIYDNLVYFNLSTFDPPTYYLILQLRSVLLGFVYQIVFQIRLNAKQWLSLFLLTIGCMIKEINFGTPLPNDQDGNYQKITGIRFGWDILWLLLQVLCSCIAGVFIESVLKRRGKDTPLMHQNIFFYSNSVICNFIAIFCTQREISLFSNSHIEAITNYKVLLIILNHSILGLTAILFVKYLNSIMKAFAVSIQLLLVMIFSWILFDIKITLTGVMSIVVVFIAVIIYSKYPIKLNIEQQVLPSPSTQLQSTPNS